MAKPRRLVTRILGDSSGPVITNLTPEQKDQITASAKMVFFGQDWDSIERARQDFAWCKWAKIQAIEHKQFAARLNAVADAARNLTIAMGGKSSTVNGHFRQYSFDKMSVLLWSELISGENFNISHSALINLLHRIERAAHRAPHRAESGAWQNDWHNFIDLLAAIFEAHGVRPTAAKSSRARNPKQSTLVNFVWSVTMTLPAGLRSHTQSRTAMAKAVADSLTFRRNNKFAGSVTLTR